MCMSQPFHNPARRLVDGFLLGPVQSSCGPYSAIQSSTTEYFGVTGEEILRVKRFFSKFYHFHTLSVASGNDHLMAALCFARRIKPV